MADTLAAARRRQADLSTRFPRMVTPIDGLRDALGSAVEIRTAHGCNAFDDDRSGFAEAVQVARWAEVVILCVGGKSGLARGCLSGGKANDRATLTLPGVQEELVASVAAIGKPIVLVVIDGRPLALTAAIESAGAALYVFPPGEEGGTAIADVLTGRVNPAARLPVSLPRDHGQMPLYYAHKPSGQRSQFWGDYADLSCKPLFPFGHGLSYSTFTYSDGNLDAIEVAPDSRLRIAISIANSGPRDGEEIVQLYLRDLTGSVTRPVMELKGFPARGATHGRKAARELRARHEPSRLSRARPDLRSRARRDGSHAGRVIAGYPLQSAVPNRRLAPPLKPTGRETYFGRDFLKGRPGKVADSMRDNIASGL